ncbi:JDVT-CTERM system glutamic-type intramembrane protease MrtJ [Viridibacterium curvum]|uniref:CAAX prenyl protease 2/Lysostaphin resistance protein A-like domain-containing protein n=1 Tax=Viridibacterium curvum TaxID=1101404 RepID=A0ABP9QJP5_9RHOO
MSATWQAQASGRASAFPWRTLLLAGALLIPAGGMAGQTLLTWQAVVLLLLAPVAEEVIFRMGLQASLLERQLAPWCANLLVAVAFAVAHWTVRGHVAALLVMLPALFIGAVYQRERRVAPCVCLHALMNLVWLFLA